MFPFTPVELHEGWLVGKERIITCISGVYEWNNPEPPCCYLFDLKGRAKENDFKIVKQSNGYKVEIKLNDWNEIAVIEESPITVKTKSPYILNITKYDKEELSFNIKGDGQADMIIKSGEFPINPSTSYEIGYGEFPVYTKIEEVKSDKKGIVSIPVELKDSPSITVAQSIKGRIFTVLVDKEKNEIKLRTCAKTYILSLVNGKLLLNIDNIPGTIPFSVAEFAYEQDFMKVKKLEKVIINKDTEEEKEVIANYSLEFAHETPVENTTRGKRLKSGISYEVKAEVEMILKVKKELPCLFLTYKIINKGEETFVCYPLVWAGGGEYYCLPGKTGIEKKEYSFKYAPIGDGVYPWVYINKKGTNGFGIIMNNKLNIAEGGNPETKWHDIYITYIPIKKDIKPGESLEMEFIFMPAEKPEEVEGIYKKINQ